MPIRSDLQLLRALAVLMVVLNHANLGLKGGFIGVDVFFVISGFVITQGWQQGKYPNLLDFYAKRFQRLLPALAVMLLGSMALIFLCLSPPEQGAALAPLPLTWLWLSNVYFISTQVDYFQSAPSWFLHTWSLAVEEQFYLIWPLLLLARQRWLLLAAAIISFALMLHWQHSQPLWAFYAMPARLWQFAVGGALVFLPVRRLPVVWLALLGLLLQAFFLDESHTYARSLLPTLTTALLIYAQITPQPSPWVRAGVWIGNVSYGWYLWHWPLLMAFQAYADGRVEVRLAAVLASLILAGLSYHGLEQPIRHARWPAKAVVSVAVVLMLAGGVLAQLHRQHSQQWQVYPVDYREADLRMSQLYRQGCDTFLQDAPPQPCRAGKGSTTVVAIGDSVLSQWFPALEATAQRQGWNLLAFTKSACPMMDIDYYFPRIAANYTVCKVWREAVLQQLIGLQPALIIVSQSSNYPFSPQQWRTASESFLKRLPAPVVYIRPTPILPFHAVNCLRQRTWQGRPAALCMADLPTSVADAPLQQAVSAVKGRWLDFNAALCPEGRCSALQGQVLVYRDEMHLAVPFVEGFAPTFERALVGR